ncbi:hypothetical protein BX600DRAFT_482827 [Xylariales sp. PMI_506]|nr:hypothetical protein BX600DRAFT_482827 [Xylariales sp. PMI_506]
MTKGRLNTSWRVSVKRLVAILGVLIMVIVLLVGGIQRRRRFLREKEAEREREREKNRPKYHWEAFPRLNGYYNGVRSLVKLPDWLPEQKATAETNFTVHKTVPLDPVVADPYHFNSPKYLEDHYPVNTCYVDAEEKYPAPEVFAYPGIPQNMSAPYWGTYENLHFTPNLCWERFGRFGPYGYSYDPAEGGLGLSNHSSNDGADRIKEMFDKVDYRNVSWGAAQKRCYEKNQHRFVESPATDKPTSDEPPKKRVERTAFVLRTWAGYDYNPIQMLSLRAMINELSLKSGGEYDVHLLVHIKDEKIPIWASEEIYNQTLRKNVPKEFWDIATLWSVPLMRLYYPGPFPPESNFENHSGDDIHGVYRSAHLALQWFSQKFPEYDYVWNWEMDVRYTGHYYEFHNGIAEWAEMQPRKLLWERSSRFWIPSLHGSWENFTQMVERETMEGDETPIWGPVQFPTAKDGMLPTLNSTRPPTSFEEDNYEWGVGEQADLIVFDPLFDPSKTNWPFRLDVTGYDTDLEPPPRRTAIITIARLSKRLLNIMHEETWRLRHTMFPEMWPPSVALHHGLKAVYAPHPVYFDRKWPLDVMDRTFNRPQVPTESPFGWGEHNMQGGSFYYNSGFSGALWRRWLGSRENNEGGREFEEKGTGRLCLRGLLHHPIKYERME